MSRPVRPDDLVSTVAELSRRLAIMERTPRVPNLTTTATLGLQSASVATAQALTSTSYGDLTTPGPSIVTTTTNSGRLLVLASARISFTGTSAAGGDGGKVGYQISGALNNVGPNDALELNITNLPNLNTLGITTSFVYVVTGLLRGDSITVSLKYRSVSGASVTFAERNLAVLPL